MLSRGMGTALALAEDTSIAKSYDVDADILNAKLSEFIFSPGTQEQVLCEVRSALWDSAYLWPPQTSQSCSSKVTT